MKRTRLKDIAELASVSQTAVSLVLNGKKSRISKEKQQEIIKIAADLNYQPNQIARSLVQQKSFTIGLIVPDITNPFFSSLAKYVEEYLYQKGYLLLIANSNNSTKHEQLLLQSYVNRQVDGILLCPSNEQLSGQKEYVNFLENLTVSPIIVDRIIKESNLQQISYDNEMGGFLATEYLIKQGCQNIACVTGPLTSQSAKGRLIGYKKALQNSFFPTLSHLIFEGDFNFDSGIHLAPKIIQSNPDGIFFSNDLMAYGFFYYLEKYNIPKEQYLVCGYDNLQLSEMFHISLPSIKQDTKVLAKKCCQSVIKNIALPKQKNITFLKPQFIIPK